MKTALLRTIIKLGNQQTQCVEILIYFYLLYCCMKHQFSKMYFFFFFHFNPFLDISDF